LKKQGIPSELVLPEEWCFDGHGRFSKRPGDSSLLSEYQKKLSSIEGVSVFPGFYGGDRKRRHCCIFTRRFDLTGGEVAFSIEAGLYENWTDTDGSIGRIPHDSGSEGDSPPYL
jgi:aspartate kinase